MSNNVYSFIEVGTADFETLIQHADDNTYGLSVEPIRKYLDRLPNKRNVTKVCAAMVTEEQFKRSPQIDVYYIEEDIINQHNLGIWMKGCNSVNKPHDFHVGYYHDAGVWHDTPDRSKLKTRNLVQEGLVTKETVNCVTYRMLMEMYDIQSVQYLKTDTEGQDADLLEDIINYYKNTETLSFLPKRIHFEDNAHTDKMKMIETKELLRTVGYDIDESHRFGHDSYADLK